MVVRTVRIHYTLQPTATLVDSLLCVRTTVVRTKNLMMTTDTIMYLIRMSLYPSTKGRMIMLNPNALLFWALGAGVGYLIDGGHGALIGFLVTGGISLLVSLRK